MSNVFKNPLVLAETVVGSIVDTRAVVLYEQPEKVKFDNIEYTTDEEGNQIETGLLELVDKRKLKELFTGYEVPFLSKINGFNMYGVSYVKADIEIESDLCDHPVETGSVITDNAIIQPITIKLQIALPTAFATRIYNEMIKYYQKKKYIMVQTKFAMYRNMVIQAMPYKLENASVDRPLVELTLRQVMEVEAQYINTENVGGITNPVDGEDSDTKDLGRKTASVVAASYGV